MRFVDILSHISNTKPSTPPKKEIKTANKKKKKNSSLHKASLMSWIVSREKHSETIVCLLTPRGLK